MEQIISEVVRKVMSGQDGAVLRVIGVLVAATFCLLAFAVVVAFLKI